MDPIDGREEGYHSNWTTSTEFERRIHPYNEGWDKIELIMLVHAAKERSEEQCYDGVKERVAALGWKMVMVNLSKDLKMVKDGNLFLINILLHYIYYHQHHHNYASTPNPLWIQKHTSPPIRPRHYISNYL